MAGGYHPAPSRDDLERIAAAVREHGSTRKAAVALGMKKSTVALWNMKANIAASQPTTPKRSIAAPSGWCDLTRDGGWQRRCYQDSEHVEIRHRRNGTEHEFARYEFDPDVIYPTDWDGPVFDEIDVRRAVYDGCKRFVLTGVQDKTPAVGPALNAMLAYAQWFGAEIVGGQVTYNRDWYGAISAAPVDRVTRSRQACATTPLRSTA